ncbi:MAG TPA: hypothetical protein VL295_05665 [Gemmatimonadales bacterium]|nr:hypothetical protein [Gemmatimonadales bacterium]
MFTRVLKERELETPKCRIPHGRMRFLDAILEWPYRITRQHLAWAAGCCIAVWVCSPRYCSFPGLIADLPLKVQRIPGNDTLRFRLRVPPQRGGYRLADIEWLDVAPCERTDDGYRTPPIWAASLSRHDGDEGWRNPFAGRDSAWLTLTYGTVPGGLEQRVRPGRLKRGVIYAARVGVAGRHSGFALFMLEADSLVARSIRYVPRDAEVCRAALELPKKPEGTPYRTVRKGSPNFGVGSLEILPRR